MPGRTWIYRLGGRAGVLADRLQSLGVATVVDRFRPLAIPGDLTGFGWV